MSCIKRALLITHILKATLIIIVIIIIIILSYVHSFIGGLSQGHPLWLWFLYITFFFNFPSLLWLWAEAAFLPKLFWILSVSEIPKSAPSVYHSINYFSSLNHLIFCLLTVLLPYVKNVKMVKTVLKCLKSKIDCVFFPWHVIVFTWWTIIPKFS